MLTVFFDSHWVAHHKYQHKAKTLTKNIISKSFVNLWCCTAQATGTLGSRNLAAASWQCSSSFQMNDSIFLVQTQCSCGSTRSLHCLRSSVWFSAVPHPQTQLKGTQFVSRDETISWTHVWWTLHEDALHHHPERVQKLHTEHSAMQLQFFHWLHTNRQVLPLILFTDEATYNHDGINKTR